MPGNGKLFVSHAHDDNERCAPLLAALDAWGVDYWFDTQQLDAGQALSDRIQRAIAERDVFVRICTPAAQRSFWMTLEAGAFSSLRADDRRRRGNRRLSIDLILEPGYDRGSARGSAPASDVTIDATGQSQAAAFAALRGALGLDSTNRRISRRTALRLSATAGAGAIVVAGAGTIFFTQRARQLAAIASPERGTPGLNLAVDQPPEDTPRVRWHVDFGAGADPAFALAAGVLYVNASDGAYALSAKDGGILWRNSALGTGALTGAGIAVDAGTVYACGGNLLAALRASDGHTIWSMVPGGVSPSALPNGLITMPVVAAGTVYVHASDNHLYALRTSDGATLWQAAFGAEDAGMVKGAPAVANGVIYAGSLDHNVYAFDAASGAKLWQFATGDVIHGTPAVASGVVYIGSEDKYLYALDAASGALLWQKQVFKPKDQFEDATPQGIQGSAVVANGVIYVGDDVGWFHALDAATGNELWARLTAVPPPTPTPGPGATPAPTPEPPTTTETVRGQPLVSGNLVYVNSNAALFAFNTAAQGAVVMALAIDRHTNSNETPQVVLDGGVLYASGSNAILAIDAPAGQ